MGRVNYVRSTMYDDKWKNTISPTLVRTLYNQPYTVSHVRTIVKGKTLVSTLLINKNILRREQYRQRRDREMAEERELRFNRQMQGL